MDDFTPVDGNLVSALFRFKWHVCAVFGLCDETEEEVVKKRKEAGVVVFLSPYRGEETVPNLLPNRINNFKL